MKDKQISAWDEITQGITKGIVAGQITPASIGAKSVSKSEDQRSILLVEGDFDPRNSKAESNTTFAKPGSSAPRSKSTTKSSRSKKKKSNSTNNSVDRSKKRPSVSVKKSKTKAKPKWFEMPTVKKYFSS